MRCVSWETCPWHALSETQTFEDIRRRQQDEINQKELPGGGWDASDPQEQSIDPNEGANELFYTVLADSPAPIIFSQGIIKIK